jgi:hypothetical protein
MAPLTRRLKLGLTAGATSRKVIDAAWPASPNAAVRGPRWKVPPRLCLTPSTEKEVVPGPRSTRCVLPATVTGHDCSGVNLAINPIPPQDTPAPDAHRG